MEQNPRIGKNLGPPYGMGAWLNPEDTSLPNMLPLQNWLLYVKG